MGNYADIISSNITRFFEDLAVNPNRPVPGTPQGNGFVLEAFGEPCRIHPDGITLGGRKECGPVGIIISLYALHARAEDCIKKPFKAFRELPGSMPYVGAFAARTENILSPHVAVIEKNGPRIISAFKGEAASARDGGDFAFSLWPLPNIMLHYVFYHADEDFPASVTCLFSNNAEAFLPTDALADTGEYTSRKILELIG